MEGGSLPRLPQGFSGRLLPCPPRCAIRQEFTTGVPCRVDASGCVEGVCARRDRRRCVSATAATGDGIFVALLLVWQAAPLSADTIDVTEAMMESQGLQAILIGANLGPDPHSTLSFVSSVDPLLKTFSYALTPGQTYLGLSASLTTLGFFNLDAQEWEWTSTGLIGALDMTGRGAAGPIAPDPPAFDLIFIDEPLDLHLGLPAGVFSDVTYTQTATRTVSEGTITVSDNQGVVLYSGRHTDNLILQGPNKGKWEWDSGDITGVFGAFRVEAEGAVPFPLGGDGAFAVQIQPVPEPGTLLLLVIGLGAGAVASRRRTSLARRSK